MNKYREQVWVLPEDDANRQIAVGFTLHESVKPRNIHVFRSAGGWTAVRDSFEREYNDRMKQSPKCVMVLLVDFDDQGEARLQQVLSRVDATLKDRVFVLGVQSEPERLKATLGVNFEKIGKTLAQECSNGTGTTWEHALMQHNRGEIERMLPVVRNIVFG